MFEAVTAMFMLKPVMKMNSSFIYMDRDKSFNNGRVSSHHLFKWPPASRAFRLTCVGGRWLSQERRADLRSACWERINSQADHAFRKNRMWRRQEAESVAY
ncbi:hypothetical protein SRHO_G00199550 [Serrasalmus rhombeus]